jgi:hypothetical protein
VPRARGKYQTRYAQQKNGGAFGILRLHQKLRIVLWRFAHNCLLTGQLLRKRNIPAFDLCCHCGRDETVEHTFLNCQYAVEIWNELKKKMWLQEISKDLYICPLGNGFSKLWMLVQRGKPLSL